MKIFVLVIVLIILISCDEKSVSSTVSKFPTSDTLTAYVPFIYDGDTFAVSIDDKNYKVRVIGIDTYESSKNDPDILERLTKQANYAKISIDSAYSLGLKGKKYADSLLKKKFVLLERRGYKSNTDVYGRLLRYVVIDGMKYDSLIIVNRLNTNL